MGLSASNSSAAFHPPLAVAFSALFKIPWVEAPARGLELSQVLPQEKLDQWKHAAAEEFPGETFRV